MALGIRLRNLRLAAGIAEAKDAAAKIHISSSKLSRMENGKAPYSLKDVCALLALYEAGPGIRDGLMDMAENAHKPGWWNAYDDVLPEFMQFRLSLEEEAYRIGIFSSLFMPGLLQIPAYARAVISSGPTGRSDSVVERMVRSRIARQEMPRRENLQLMRIVIDESVLRRPWGGHQVMAEQIRHVRRVIEEQANVSIRIAPLDPPATVHCGPLTTFEFEDPQLPHIVYLEQRHGAEYLDSEIVVEEYRKSYEVLVTSSLPRPRTLEMLERYEKQYS